VELQFRPIEHWQGKLTTDRRRSQFRASYGKTLALLDRELRHLGARDVFLQAAFGPEDIRLDGRPRNHAKATHPGVILTFLSKYGPLQYPCDRFDHWQDNLRAIALSLKHLRDVDRYGVTKHGEQYRGWEQLSYKGAAMSRDEALRILSPFTRNGSPRTPQELEAAYREGAKQLHPDRGGNAQEFQQLLSAHEVLTR
jgi:hypothetical protein